jgi:hypothetical protein
MQWGIGSLEFVRAMACLTRAPLQYVIPPKLVWHLTNRKVIG